MTARRAGRTTVACVASVALGLLATACGGSSDGGAPAPSSTPLTAALAQQALLTTDDLSGSTFTASNDNGSSGAGQVGCLKATDTLSSLQTPVKVRSAFVTALTDGASGVLNQIFSSDDATTVQQAYDTFASAVGGCTSVRDTTSDGVSIDLTVATNTTVTDPAASQQLNLDAKGTLATSGKTYDYHVGFSVSMVDGALVLVAVYDLGATPDPLVPQLPDLDKVVVDRLAALA